MTELFTPILYYFQENRQKFPDVPTECWEGILKTENFSIFMDLIKNIYEKNSNLVWFGDMMMIKFRSRFCNSITII